MKRYTLVDLAKDIKRRHERQYGCEGCPSYEDCIRRFGEEHEPETLEDFRALAKDYWKVDNVADISDEELS